MPVVCTRCSTVYDQGHACPLCAAPPPGMAVGGGNGLGPRWQQTAVGRIFIGLVLAQGLFYGLRHLLAGVLLAVQADDGSVWDDPRNVFLLLSFQAFAVLAGGVFAGAGQRYGIALGAFTGVWNGVLAAVLRQNPHADVASLGFFTQPALQTAVGAVGGLVGALVWRPLSSGAAVSARKPVAKQKSRLLAGPVAWIRVLAGSACVVVGSLYAAALFRKILDLSDNKLGTTEDYQDVLIIWEIRALLILLGAAAAGAGTRNGFKQGLCVGVVATSILIGLQAPGAKSVVTMAALTGVATLALSVAGGWFGGQLLPPVARRGKRRVDGTPAW